MLTTILLVLLVLWLLGGFVMPSAGAVLNLLLVAVLVYVVLEIANRNKNL